MLIVVTITIRTSHWFIICALDAYILMGLEYCMLVFSVSLCRCAGVNRAWKALAEESYLWSNLCLQQNWRLTQVEEHKQMINHMGSSIQVFITPTTIVYSWNWMFLLYMIIRLDCIFFNFLWYLGEWGWCVCKWVPRNIHIQDREIEWDVKLQIFKKGHHLSPSVIYNVLLVVGYPSPNQVPW